MPLFQAVFSIFLKTEKICPVNKKGDPLLKENYRPTALLPGFSKILERAVHTQLLNFLGTNNKLTDCHFRFCTNKFTNPNVQCLARAIDSGQRVNGCFLNLSNAFDMVQGDILYDPLHSLGIRGNCLKWLESYMTDWKQYLEIQHNHLYQTSLHSSDLKKCYNRSAQGSLLFLVYKV